MSATGFELRRRQEAERKRLEVEQVEQDAPVEIQGSQEAQEVKEDLEPQKDLPETLQEEPKPKRRNRNK